VTHGASQERKVWHVAAMRAKLVVVFILGIAVGIALTATIWRPATPSAGAPGTERALTAEELQKVTGLVGIRNDGALCGDLYNGNRELSVTEVELRIVSFADADSTVRSYLYGPADSAITSLGTRKFCIEFLLEDDEDFTWGIVAARGKAQ
jgi:hypothetical protein